MNSPYSAKLVLGLGMICFLAACAQKEVPPTGDSSTISYPLVVDVYQIKRTPDSRLVVTLDWPERFGKFVSSVSLAELDLAKAQITEAKGGRWATNFEVDLPVKSGRKSVEVQTWPPWSEPYSAKPEGTYRDDQVTFHSPNRNAARQTLQTLKRWQSQEPQ